MIISRHPLIAVATAAFLFNIVSTKTIEGVEREVDNETQRIVGGRNAKPGQFPWVVALHYNNRFVCTASIISPTTILTAAHCVIIDGQVQPPELFYAIANVSRSAETVRTEFASITPHPKYEDQNIDNDVAVMKTLAPIQFDDVNGEVRPVCIAEPGTPSLEGEKVIAMGWGDVTPIGTILPIFLPETLQYAEMKVIPNNRCAFINPGINDEKICAKGFSWRGFSGICAGDSGGPLVHMSTDNVPVIVGIASYINGLFGCGNIAPGVFTRASSHYDFIMQAAGDGLICTV